MPNQFTGLKLDLEWRISLITALLLPALLFLGYWQLQRADEKALLASSWQARAEQPPVALSELDPGSPQSITYVPVVLRGRFSAEKYFLLDNRIYGGRFGYEVLALFELEASAGSVLVNRGWLAGDASRLTLPAVPAVTDPVRISGHVYVAPGKPYLLSEQVLAPGWPKRIQAVEMSKLRSALGDLHGGSMFPYPVRIDALQPGALTVDWQVINISPEKHRGYAFQWFTMAAVLGLYFIFRSSNLWRLLSGNRSKL
jgi:surfeit locus 1 family protein